MRDDWDRDWDRREAAALADPEMRKALDEARNPDRAKGIDRGSFAQYAEGWPED